MQSYTRNDRKLFFFLPARYPRRQVSLECFCLPSSSYVILSDVAHYVHWESYQPEDVGNVVSAANMCDGRP